MEIRETTAKKKYLNIGCGNIHAADWNNLDFIKNKDIVCWDIRKGLPYPDSSMDAVYSSHLLEHLSPGEGRNLLGEVRRVLKKDGIIRIVVPDLEGICREYLARLEEVKISSSFEKEQRYDWIMLELIDQMVREKRGGLMRETIDSGNFDREYAKVRIGDLAFGGQTEKKKPDSKVITFLKTLKRRLKAFTVSDDPHRTGEVHKWMYDRFSLARLLSKQGFGDIEISRFDRSSIPDWDRYEFDRSKFDLQKAKKLESLFMEARKK